MIAVSAPVERFTQKIPDRPWCSDDPRRFGVRIRPREIALRSAYLQPNFPWFISYIPLDLDREGAALIAEQLALPRPTITTVNPDSSHAHLLFELRRPVSTANFKAASFLRTVRKALMLSFGADPGYTGLLTQNPISPRWLTQESDVAYTLSDLAEALPAESLRAAREWPKAGAGALNPLEVASRNLDCFEYVRHFGYRLVGQCSNEYELYERIFAICRKRNGSYSPPMTDSELRSTAKSITRWCWKRRGSLMRRRAGRRRRGVLQLPPGLSMEERQRKGAQFTHMIRRTNTGDRIDRALAELGPSAPGAAIAAMADVNIRTVRRYARKNSALVSDAPEGAFS
jgi:hypothetical protein